MRTTSSAEGTPTAYALGSAGGASIRTLTRGAILQSIQVPDRHGTLADVVLGFDAPEQYLHNPSYFGAIVGRYANRIARGRFTLDDRPYQLATNNGLNHLHGGTVGFDRADWRAEPFTRRGAQGVAYSHVSEDGDQGYPGALAVRVTYLLDDQNRLFIEYEATATAPTVLNLTQHSYFNLAGGGTILDHVLQIEANRYTPVDDTLIPTGEEASVDRTPFDFRRPHRIGERIAADAVQLRRAGGYDHNWIIDGAAGTLRHAARLWDPESGRTLDIETTQPGLQFYSGNVLDGSGTGKGGSRYERHAALCLETQHYPDSPNHPNFPSTVLRPGERFHERTVLTFGIADQP